MALAGKIVPDESAALRERLNEAAAQIAAVILGKDTEIRLALTALFAGGHLLIEDVPGVGKTTLAKALSRTLGLGFRRIQFTSDLLPADVVGVSIYRPDSGTFDFHPGPIFTSVVLADELNRATPKTQSALLEAMAEAQVSTDGRTLPLPKPFFVIATQNPHDQAGAYPLPESQLDRFLLTISLGLPNREAERHLLRRDAHQEILDNLPPLFDSAAVLAIQQQVAHLHVSDALLDYVQDLLAASRSTGAFRHGLSPRAGLALLAAGRAHAYLAGRDFALPEDIKAVFVALARHRLTPLNEIRDGIGPQLDRLLEDVPVP